MLIIAAKLYSDQGVPLPRHREITTRYTRVGQLSLSEVFVREFRRSMRVAKLFGSGDGGMVFPMLYDAAIVWVGDGELRVRGFEVNQITQAHVAMVWGAEILADQRPGRVLVPRDGDATISIITSQAGLENMTATTSDSRLKGT